MINSSSTMRSHASLVICFGLTTLVNAQPGTLDPSFGNGGMVVTQLTPQAEHARAIAVQADGRIIVVSGDPYGDTQIPILRYMPNGDPDTSFGSGGIATLVFSTALTMGNAVQVQPDGRIVVAGYTTMSGGEVMAVARLNVDGTLDTSFSGDGLATFNIPFSCLNEQVADLTLRPDGRMVLTGHCSTANYTIVMTAGITSSGVFDYAGFHSPDGWIGFDVGVDQMDDWATGAVLLDDGSIVVTGFSLIGSDADFFATKLDPFGEFNFGFSAPDGYLRTDMGATTDYAYASVLQPNGRVVIAGRSELDWALYGVLQSGAPDGTFGTNGKVFHAMGTYDSQLYAAVLQPWDKIIAVGTSAYSNGDSKFTVARFLEDGSLDPGFGNGGVTRTFILGLAGAATCVALQPDGKIVLAGWVLDGTDQGIGLARFENDIALDALNTAPLKRRLTAFPIPFCEELRVRGTTSGLPYMICDAIGRVVQNGTTLDEQTLFNTAGLASGSYTVHVGGEVLRVLKL